MSVAAARLGTLVKHLRREDVALTLRRAIDETRCRTPFEYQRRRQSCCAATYHNDIEFAHVIELADSV
jgi:hypothetical protein